MKKGISLIVLVITIIVIIILAGSVILSLSSNNPIAQATDAKAKTTVETYNSELNLAISSQFLSNYLFTSDTFNAPVWDGIDANKAGTIKQYITSITPTDALKYEIQNSKLVYIGTIQTEKDWNIAMGITVSQPLYTMVKPLVSDVNKYKTPYIPTGFKYKEGNWNIGLVIEDTLGNQFVWIPVDGTNVPYAKWCTTNVSYLSTTEDALPLGVTSETTQITNYGGFYISRYESGKEGTNTLVSKKLKTAWNFINYTDSKILAESMYTTATLKSGLLTGTQWDTLMKWLQNSGKNIIDSRNWGNHNDSIAPANVTGTVGLRTTGYSEIWKSNNIYDVSGNMWEWTSELSATNNIFRGGDFCSSGLTWPTAFRNVYPGNFTHDGLAFRIVLYIM
jgi:hypothetical protein